MSKIDLPKAYEPQQYEDAMYAAWEKSGFFNPDNLSGEPYAIMMPPPNVTGVLHLGHALENTLMDTMARFQRMRGKKVLLLAGTDHAAVATQARVEKDLVAAGIAHPREHFGREGLLTKIREYAEASKATILSQIKKMGTSADWSRLAYTFDDARGRAVNEVFVRMYKDGLIYRGSRVINWSVKGQSTCSDDELVYVDRKAMLYTFKYSKDFPFAIASTRPETKLGDTAVAVHPKDKRYKKFIGKTFDVHFCGTPLSLKIIADEGIDPDFGTGALGVTPAHSPMDFEMYEKQKAADNEIGLIQVIGADGKMTKSAGAFAGLTSEQAREQIVERLRAEGLLEQEQEIDQSVGTSDRFGDVVEAIPMTQWFVAVNKKIPGKGKTLKELMKEAVAKKITITPERFEDSYYGWIDHLRDWCISRQIWWGHRIPVWYRSVILRPTCPTKPWRSGKAEGSHASRDSSSAVRPPQNDMFVGVEPPQGDGWEQDPDTLDTWFSSGLWTFSTLGWPDATADLKTYHPTAWMQMGYEILFFWMARMILMSAYALDEIPFRQVYIHGMLRDKTGQKFSKSLGNGIDPLDVIARYGADALRVSLVIGVTPGNDARFSLEKVEASQHLVNKFWNIARFVLGQIDSVCHSESATGGRRISRDAGSFAGAQDDKTLADQWILSRLHAVVATITKQLDGYEFSQASETLREFTWGEFADWYVEIAKVQKRNGKNETDGVLLYVLETLLKLWHPFMPFVTEAIWKEMGKEKFLMVEEWPTKVPPLPKGGLGGVADAVVKFASVQSIITSIRNLRSLYHVEPTATLEAVVTGKDIEALATESETIKALARLSALRFEKSSAKPDGAVSAVVGNATIHLILAGAVDLEKERARLQKELEETRAYVTSVDHKLADKEFLRKAPAHVVDQMRSKRGDAIRKVVALEQNH